MRVWCFDKLPAAPYSAEAHQVQALAWVGPLLLALAWLTVQAGLAPHTTVYPDSARYAALAWRYQGVPADLAERRAIALLCDARDDPAGCYQQEGGHLEPTTSPRYEAFFSTRPGYPAVVAALEPAVGMKAALWAVAVWATCAAGLLVFWLGRLFGAPPGWAMAGQVGLYVSPAGWWGAQRLTEGPLIATICAAAVGAVLLARGRLPAGTALLVAGLGAGVAVKFSTAALLAAGLAVAGLFAVAAGWGHRRGLTVLAGVSVAVVVVVAWASARYGWPSVADTAQDMFTGHFAQPDVGDLTGALLAQNVYFWGWWVQQPTSLLLAAGTLTAAWMLWRVDRTVCLVVLAAAATGWAAVTVHPDPGQLDRLYVTAWLAPVVALPASAASQADRKGRSVAPSNSRM